MRRRRAFTLVEIIVVILVVSVLLFASVPVFSHLIRFVELDVASRGIVSDLRFAQEEAIAGKCDVSVEFFRRSGDSASYVIKRSDVGVKRVELGRRLDFQNGRTIKFASSGYPPPGGSGTIVVEGVSGRERKIIISSAGRIRRE
jgi:prepilin-type N-terminal cleavage/methylation domain-containing protein